MPRQTNLADSRVAILARLMERKDRIQAIAPFLVTERRILLLLLVWTGRISAYDVKLAVRGLTSSAHYSKLHRLIHHTETYKQLRDLEAFGVLSRHKRDDRVRFGLQRSMRSKLACVVGDIMPARLSARAR